MGFCGSASSTKQVAGDLGQVSLRRCAASDVWGMVGRELRTVCMNLQLQKVLCGHRTASQRVEMSNFWEGLAEDLVLPGMPTTRSCALGISAWMPESSATR